jgi:two-component system LytT family response regulator
MQTIIIDDEYANQENLQFLLARHCPEVTIVGVANTIEEAKLQINHHHPDLLFLDIQMGRKSGFDLLRSIEDKSFEVIFVTAFDQYGIQAIKFAALDYLLKPVDIDELKNAVKKAEHKLASKIQHNQINFLLQQLQKHEPSIAKIALPQLNEIRYVVISDIIRCVADNTYTYFHLVDGELLLISKPLKEYADLLKPHGFIRVHQSHLVNPKYVKSWLKEDGGILLFNNGIKVPVSKPNREYVKSILSR